MEYWDKENECMAREEIEQLQLERLQATLNRVYKNVRHFRKTFSEIDFMPEDLTNLADLTRLPFVTREDLKANYPYDMFAVPLREVVRLHAPDLGFGSPEVMGLTAGDRRNWAELMARNLAAVGVGRDDVVQVSLPFSKTTGAFGVQLGTELVGASVIPISDKRLESQVKVMRDFRATVLFTTPTIALGMAGAMDDAGIDPMSLTLRSAILTSEPWSETTRGSLLGRLKAEAFDCYGLSEVFGPGVAMECPVRAGLHIAEDHFIPEIIDPDTLETLPAGSFGELVLTTLTKEAFPLIRFRTGDMARLDYTTCECGRTHVRISRMNKRCDGVVVMRGCSVVPAQIGAVLARATGGVTPDHQLVVEREGAVDRLTVLVAISDTLFFDEMRKQRRFVENLHQELLQFLGWEAVVRLVEPGTFDPAVPVTDKRRFD